MKSAACCFNSVIDIGRVNLAGLICALSDGGRNLSYFFVSDKIKMVCFLIFF